MGDLWNHSEARIVEVLYEPDLNRLTIRKDIGRFSENCPKVEVKKIVLKSPITSIIIKEYS